MQSATAAATPLEPRASTTRLINISTRALVGTGTSLLIPGFVVGGNGTETLLIRADGPALSDFGVSGVLAQPSLSLLSGTTVVASNTGWETSSNPAQLASVAAQVGAFAFKSGSADCALIASVPPGAYTVQVSGVGDTTGVALAEIYEVSTTGTRLVNISTRAQVGTGGNILIPGFIVGGSGTEQLLARADGPSLTQFGVTGVLAQPSLSVYEGTAVVATDTGWGANADAAEIASVASTVGAFAFASGSADSAVIVGLAPGSYTMQVAGADGTTGVALAEVYEDTAGAGTPASLVLSTSAAAPGSSLAITGATFNPALTTHVNFTDSAGKVLSILADNVTAGEVDVTVPPYLSVATFQSVSAAVNVSVVQQPASGTAVTFGPVANFSIGSLPVSGLPPGTITVLFLQQEQILLTLATQNWTSIQTASNGSVSAAAVLAQLAAAQTDITGAIAQIQTLQGGSVSQLAIGTYSGGTVYLDSTGLGLLDQTILAYLFNGTLVAQGLGGRPVPRVLRADGLTDWPTMLGTYFNNLEASFKDASATTQILTFGKVFRTATCALIAGGTAVAAFASGPAAPAVLAEGSELGLAVWGGTTFSSYGLAALMAGSSNGVVDGASTSSDLDQLFDFMKDGLYDLATKQILAAIVIFPANQIQGELGEYADQLAGTIEPALNALFDRGTEGTVASETQGDLANIQAAINGATNGLTPTPTPTPSSSTGTSAYAGTYTFTFGAGTETIPGYTFTAPDGLGGTISTPIAALTSPFTPFSFSGAIQVGSFQENLGSDGSYTGSLSANGSSFSIVYTLPSSNPAFGTLTLTITGSFVINSNGTVTGSGSWQYSQDYYLSVGAPTGFSYSPSTVTITGSGSWSAAQP